MADFTMHVRGPAVSLGLALCVLMPGSPAARAATRTWNAPAGGAWSDPANWLSNAVPTGASDVVVFSTVGDGTTNTLDLSGFRVGSWRLAQGRHITDLAGNTFTALSVTVDGLGVGVTGALAVAGAGTVVAEDSLSIGVGANADASMSLAADVALQVGLATNDRAVLKVGENTGGTTSYGSASLEAGHAFSAYVSSLAVGRRNAGFSSGTSYGYLDLSGVTSPGVLDVSGAVDLGVDRQAAGVVVVSDAVDVRIGTASSRGGHLWVAQSSHSASTPPSRLHMGSGRFDAYVTELRVADGSVCDGSLLATSACGVLDVSGDVYVASATPSRGAVAVGDGMALRIGSPSSRSNVRMGLGDSYTRASLTAGTNVFEAYLGLVSVGVSGGFGGCSNIVDLSAVGRGLLEVGGPVIVGVGRGCNVAFSLGRGFATTIGAATNRTGVAIGDGDRPERIAFTAGGTFATYLTNLVVGRNAGANAATTDCLLDLAACTSVVLDVQGDMLIATGRDARGTVVLPRASVSVSNLIVGVGTDAGVRGRLQLNGTVFGVSGGVSMSGSSVANKGRIDVAVMGAPAGLDLAESATLNVVTGIVSITFSNPASYYPVYWGLRWPGDHVAALTNLAATGRLAWDASALTHTSIDGPVGVFARGGVTYVGATMRRPGITLEIR